MTFIAESWSWRWFPIYYDQKPLKKRTDLVNETIAFYQTALDMLKKKKYQN
jgi:hypothetical protein